jgi:hypothetical protein
MRRKRRACGGGRGGGADRRRKAEHGVTDARALCSGNRHAIFSRLAKAHDTHCIQVEFSCQFVRISELRIESIFETVLHVHVFLPCLLQRNAQFGQEGVKFRGCAVLPDLELRGYVIRVFHRIV